MVLYRLAGVGDDPQMSSLSPPVTLNNGANSRRASRFSTLSSSSYSIFGDSKYPVPAAEDGTLTPPPQGVFLAYEYDPSWDQDLPDDEEDELHKPDEPGKAARGALWSTRGAVNICVMVTILVALVFLFALYPIISHYDSKARTGLFTGTDHSNNPGGDGNGLNNSYTRTSDQLIDPDTPDEAKSRAGFDGNQYTLVFSDEFKMEGRTFKTGADPFWEAVDLHDAKNQDLNWYDTGEWQRLLIRS
jgi:beta-glucan synthesis-associated protein KRE6